jgi:hypothetical protein
MKVFVLLIAGVVAVATEPATAIDFSRVDLRPNVLVSSHLVISNIFDPDELTYEEQQMFITQGGATFSSFSAQVEQGVPSSQIYRGIATPAQLRDFRANLNTAKIGAHRSCEIKTIGSQEGYFDITWNSLRGRRNAFRVVVTFTGGSGLPPCRETLIQLLADIREFESDILTNSGTEVLSTPH